jgi:DNA-binding GntR family transcriptional regulator
MRMASEKNMHHEYFIANLAFHMSIIHMAGNKNLETIYEGVCKRASLFRRTSLSTPGRLAISLKQHQAIFDAIAAGNSEKTAALMHHHIMDAKSVLAASCASPEKTITT